MRRIALSASPSRNLATVKAMVPVVVLALAMSGAKEPVVESHRDEDDDLLIVMVTELVDECHDGPGHRRLLGVGDLQWHAGVPARPLLLHLLGSLGACFAVFEHDGYGDHVRADRQRLADGVLGQPGHAGQGHDHHERAGPRG